MPLQLISPPTAEPVHLDEAKLHLRVEDCSDDLLIGALISAAREYAEAETRKQMVAARWKQVLDAFPQSYMLSGNAILLERGPVLRVVSIQYLDMAGVVQTMPEADYTIDYSSEPVRITPVFGKIWPIPMPQIGAVWVNFDAGYAAPIMADVTANTISAPTWLPMNVGDTLRLSNGIGELPEPLLPNMDYYVESVVSPGVYTLSSTNGGESIDLLDTDIGQSFIGVIPEGLKAWLKIRLSTLYENREEVAILTKGKIEPLPYVDRLLDPYRVVTF